MDTLNYRNQALSNYYIIKTQSEPIPGSGLWQGTFLKPGYTFFELLNTMFTGVLGKYTWVGIPDYILEIDPNIQDLRTYTPIPNDMTIKEVLQLVAQALGAAIIVERQPNAQNKGIIKLVSLRKSSPIYDFNYNNSEIPKSILTPKLKSIKVKRYEYNVQQQRTDIVTFNKNTNTAQEFTAYIGYVGDSGTRHQIRSGNISGSGISTGYYDRTITWYIPEKSGTQDIDYIFVAQKVDVLEKFYEKQVMETGDTLEIDNIFCSTPEIAQRIANNYEYWYKQRFNYEVPYRGEPALACGDNVMAQTEFNDNVQANLISNSYDWENGAIKNAKAGLKVGAGKG